MAPGSIRPGVKGARNVRASVAKTAQDDASQDVTLVASDQEQDEGESSGAEIQALLKSMLASVRHK